MQQNSAKTPSKGSFRSTLAKRRDIAVRAWAAIMLLGLAVGLIFFARPSTSTVEKRELTRFPAFDVSSFVDGGFFTDLSLWYADTYPLREPMVAASQTMKKLYGVQPEVKFVGGNVVADDLNAAQSEDSASQTGASQTTSPKQFEETDVPEAKPMQEAMQEQLMAGLYLKGGAAYNVYYFVEESAASYIEAVNTLASELEGSAQVYSMLIPNGSAILLDDDELAALGGTDQDEAIAYFYGQMSDLVAPVDVAGALREHKDEYLFFRTDHHWTQLGAYYSYEAFCKARGFEAQDISGWEQMEFDDFLGTFYAETNDPSLAADTVTAYVPPQTNDISFVDSSGEQIESHVINDVSDWGQGTGYYCYGIGDYQLTHVENPQKSDGSSCLLLKDSYGNCLAPQLIGHYQDLWVIDYRYSSTDIVAFAREHGIDDVIVENNISIASAMTVSASLLDQVTRSGAHGQTGEGRQAQEEAPGTTEASSVAEPASGS